MPGKYSNLRDKLERKVFKDADAHDPTYQSKVDAEKSKLQDLNLSQLAMELKVSVGLKKDLENDLKLINLHLEAVNQLMVKLMEEDGQLSVKYNIGTFSIQDKPYVTVEDRAALQAWIEEQRRDEFYQINHARLASDVTECLTEGVPTPPGVKVYLRSYVQMYTQGA